MTLDQWLKEERLTNVWLARKVGASAKYISALRRGRGNPSRLMAREIEKVTLGKVTQWKGGNDETQS